MYTEEQVKELLKEQRENCLEAYCFAPYIKNETKRIAQDRLLILNAEEPSIPEPINLQEPIGKEKIKEFIKEQMLYASSFLITTQGIKRYLEHLDLSPLYGKPQPQAIEKERKCMTCNEEITGHGYCSVYCATEQI